MKISSVDLEMRSYLQRIATGPELSKDLSEEETYRAMTHILAGSADEVQSAIFLIALRMKRETDAENCGALRALLDSTVQVRSDVADILHVTDPFDGFVRGLPAAPFLPAVLAACGVATISSGAQQVGPKYGTTHRQVLEAAGAAVELVPAEAAMQVGDPSCGWAYVDQRYACPDLHQLVDLRSRIVKRPLLTTLEVLLAPVLGQESTHLVTGYVHKPYPPIYAMLARRAGFASAAIVRGVEGGVIASLNQPSKLLRFTADRDNEEIRLDPTLAGINSQTRAVPLPDVLSPATAQSELPDEDENYRRALATAQAGRLALAGTPGPMCDSLIYGAAVCLLHLGVENSLKGASATVRSVLDSGQPTARFDAGCY